MLHEPREFGESIKKDAPWSQMDVSILKENDLIKPRGKFSENSSVEMLKIYNFEKTAQNALFSNATTDVTCSSKVFRIGVVDKKNK